MDSQDYGTIAKALVDNLTKITYDRASLARLRRCQGRDYDEAVDAYPVFMRVLPTHARGSSSLERTCFTVASLFAGYPKQVDLRPENAVDAVSIGRALAAVVKRDPKLRDSVERRLGALLRTDVDALPFRLRQTVHFLASKDVTFDWVQLTTDLARWGQPSHAVQKRWARQFYEDFTNSEPNVAQAVEPEDENAR